MTFENSVYNINPYYDDFNANKGFQRILFRPGFSVQARELTQLQTILQNQIKDFGDHIFESGSLVSGGQISESTLFYVRIQTTGIQQLSGLVWENISNSQIPSALREITDTEFGIGNNSYTNGVGRIVGTLENNSQSDPHHYIFFNFLTGNVTINPSNVIELQTPLGNRYRFQVKPSGGQIPHTGKARIVTTQPGIYFVDGSFVLAPSQRVVPYNISTSQLNTDGPNLGIATGAKMFENPTARVGFAVENIIVTSDDDASLLDPANDAPNFSAPGADRLKKNLLLSFTAFESGGNAISNYVSDNFVEILRYENGIVTKKQNYPDYAVLEETFARRTLDESGNYTVSDFGLQIKEHLKLPSNDGVYTTGGDSSKLVAILDPGKAYIGGYEFETISRNYLDFNKSRTFDISQDNIVNANIGNYIIIGPAVGTTNGFGNGCNEINTSRHVDSFLRNSLGVTLGTAKIRQIDIQNPVTNEYRLYLYDVRMNIDTNFSDTKSIVASDGDTIGIISTTSGIDSSGNTILYSPTQDSLVIPLPINSTIKTVIDADYQVQLSFEATASGGQIQVSVPSKGGDPITFPGDVNGPVPPSLLNNRYYLINRTTGLFVNDFTGITFTTSNDNETITVGGLDNEDLYTLIANCVVNTTSSSFFKRTKSLGNVESVTGITLGLDSFSGSTFGNIGYPDVYVIENIFSENSQTNEDIKSKFILDDGQRDNIYDHARIILKSGSVLTPDQNEFTIEFRRFTHTGDGPFVADSYPVGIAYGGATFGYENIPSFRSRKTGTSISLRDALDFRPVKMFGGTFVENAWIPVAKESMAASFEYYLPRIDRIILSGNREFKVVQGVPSLDPTPPYVDPSGLTLYTIRIGPWTFGPSDSEVQYHETKRYTMNDIGQIEKRVEDLEYYSSLSFLESDANSRTFVTNSNSIIPKVGIVVDGFTGHDIGDVNNKDYNCAMDFESGLLRPAFNTKNISIIRDTSPNLVNVRIHDQDTTNNADERNSLYTLEYVVERAISNPLADNSININPTGKIDWYGYMDLVPSSDDWYFEEKRPDIKSNKYGINDAWEYRAGNQENAAFGFGTQWRDWEYNWFGRPRTDMEIRENAFLENSRIYDETFSGSSTAVRSRYHDFLASSQIRSISGSSRKSITKNSTPDAILKTVDDRIVNDAVKSFSRPVTIKYKLSSMKPSTRVYIFVENVLKQPLLGALTDSKGELNGAVIIDAGEFTSGDVLIRAIDNIDNNLSLATTVSEATFRISGVGTVYDPYILSTRPTVTRRAGLNDERISASSVISRNSVEGSGAKSLDHMAQNFIVDSSVYPKGMFVKSLDLMFIRKPNENDKDLPVTIEIRPTISGYPHPSKIVPGSVKSLPKDSITITSIPIFGSNLTTFAFDYPVYLKPGEYSIIVRSNSNKYFAYTGTVGNNVISSERITQQPYVGKFFKPQNAGTYIPDESQFLSFSLNRCKFTTANGTLILRNIPFAVPSAFSYDSYYIHSTSLDLGRSQNSSQLAFSIQTNDLNGGLSSSPVPTNINQTVVPLDSRGTQIVRPGEKNIIITVQMISDNDAISPVIDMQRFSFVAIQNDINNSSSRVSTGVNGDGIDNGELDPIILDSVDSVRVSKSRYITKNVVLDSGISATDLRVILDVSQPSGSLVQVFAKVLNASDVVDFDGKNYIELVPNRIPTYEGENSFSEIEYSALDSSDFGSFDVFSVKIVFHSNDQFVVPKAKDLRAVALA